MNYLITTFSYINSDEDWEYTSKLLNHLVDNNMDVAVLTHSDKFLTELSKLCKYVYYNNNNTLVKFKDYLSNINSLNVDNMCLYGHAWMWQSFEFGSFSKKFLVTPHTPACLKLLKMGIKVAKENNYKWIVILHDDCAIPELGFKYFIEEKIIELEQKNKDWFYIYNDICLMPYPITIINVNCIYNIPELFETNWDIDKSSFIKNFGFSFYESILHLLCEKYCTNGCISEPLDLSLEKYYTNNKIINIKTSMVDFENCISIHIVPYKKNEKFYLAYFSFNKFNKKIDLKNICVFKNEHIIFKKDYSDLDSYNWELFFFESINFSDKDLIKLSYSVLYNDKEYFYEESFIYENIEQIYNKLLKIELK